MSRAFGDVPGELEAAADDLIERSRARQPGLPLVVEDEATLRRVATIARDRDAGKGRGAA